MSNPQKELFKALAETNVRSRHIKALHQGRIERIPEIQKVMRMRMDALQVEIEAAGIGNATDAEDEYLELLEDFQHLDQSYDLHKLAHRTSRDGTPRLNKSLSADDRRAIAYGQMLWNIYGGGALVKGASEDLQYWGARLKQMTDNRARTLGENLCSIQKSNPSANLARPSSS